jgi:hypothetical protein
VSFQDEAGLSAYRTDPEYVALAGARTEAISDTKIFTGSLAPGFED